MTLSRQQNQNLTSTTSTTKFYLILFARFLLVSEFYQDGIRTLLQFPSRLYFFQQTRHLNSPLPELYVSFIPLIILIFTTLIVFDKYTKLAITGLIAIWMLQEAVYGVEVNFKLFLSCICYFVGIAVLLVEGMVNGGKNKDNGLQLNREKEKEAYLIEDGLQGIEKKLQFDLRSNANSVIYPKEAS